MAEIDRRGLLSGILHGAAVVALGLAVMPAVAEAAPLAIGETGAATSEGAGKLGHFGPERRVQILPREQKKPSRSSGGKE
jgi:hypothetical protein